MTELDWYELDQERDYIARSKGYESWEDYKESEQKLEERLEL